MNTFKLKISTPDGARFDGECVKLDVRGIDGELAVMPGHIPFMTAVKAGHCRIMLPDGEVREAELDGGMLSVAADLTTLLSSGFRFKEK